MIVPEIALLLIRSFGEHRARPGARERTAIVEGSWILGPLFLFNNLHSVHHDEPTMAWYEYNRRSAPTATNSSGRMAGSFIKVISTWRAGTCSAA